MIWNQLADGGTIAHVVYSLVLLVILGSALIVRQRARGKRGQVFRHAAIWIAIATGLLLAYSLKDQLMLLARGVAADLVPQLGIERGESITFRARNDGHFLVEAAVNGTPINFVVDSGATDVVLSPRDAERLGFELQALRFDKVHRTANGLVRGAPVRLGKVSIGPITLTDVRASVNGAAMETSLLGMSFLARLSAWRVEGDRITLVR